MRIFVLAWLALAAACVLNVPGATRPPVTTGGTWSCQQIVEQCDASCEAPSCLDECTARGTPAAQEQHNALVSCGQRSFCTDEECMRANCSDEITSCAGDPPAAAPGAGPDAPAA